MSTALDMSLDDLIKNNKRSSRGGGGGSTSRGRGRGGSGGPGPLRRFPNRSSNRSNPYSAPKSRDSAFMAVEQMKIGGRSSGIETGTKLYISNLDYGVSNEDIKELFSELGDIKKYSINYDRSGRSKGTAEVVFARKADALLAVKKYNNVQLDGKPMKIEVVAPIVPAITSGIFGNTNGANRSGQGRGGAPGRSRGGDGGSRGRGSGRGRGRGRGRNEALSADVLDADLEKYHTEAMQIN